MLGHYTLQDSVFKSTDPGAQEGSQAQVFEAGSPVLVGIPSLSSVAAAGTLNPKP